MLPRACAGFTLVELIVAMMITLLLAGATAAVLRSVTAARRIVETRLQGEQEATVALQIIAGSLRNAYRPVTDNDLLFDGTQDPDSAFPASRVRFRAVERRVVRPGQPESDVHELEFFMRDDEAGRRLMRRTDPAPHLWPQRSGVVEPLALEVVGLDLQYFDGQRWLDLWPQSRQSWPEAVSIRLLYRADSASGRVASVSRLVNFPYWNSDQTSSSGGNQP